MKFLNYNVNGIRAAINKGLYSLIEEENPDIFSLEEVKAFKEQADLSQLKKTYNIYWNPAKRKGYSGTAVFSKVKPLNVYYEFDLLNKDNSSLLLDFLKEYKDSEGRVITLEFDNYYFVAVYTPNAGDGLKRLDFRMKWDEIFREYIKYLDTKKTVIITGDLNVAHNEIDLKNPSSNHKNPGFTDEERYSFTKTLSLGFTDTFRCLYPSKQEFSWYSYRFSAKEKGIGWRIDYFLTSSRIMNNVKNSYILQEPNASDHQPIILEIDI